MKILELIEEFEDKLESQSNFLGTKKVMIDRTEIFNLLKDIQLLLPDEMKHAKWIKEERDKIFEDAKMEADKILAEARTKEKSMLDNAKSQFENLVDSHEVLEAAKLRASEVIESAKEEARTIRANAYEYSEDIMVEIRKDLVGKLTGLDKDIKELQKFMKK